MTINSWPARTAEVGSILDIVLTGVARSGTTLACRLLNTLPHVVALHEPMPLGLWSESGDGDAAVDQLQGFFSAQRRCVLQSGKALSLASSEGIIPDNSFSNRINSRGKRSVSVSLQEVTIDKVLEEDFSLVLKHPAAFVALLPLLVQRWPCFALVRNPLAVLMSWNSIDMKVQDGRIPLAEAFNPPLRRMLNDASSAMERQLIALDFFFAQISTFIPNEQVIPYERLIATQGAALEIVTPTAGPIRASLKERNANMLYDRKLAWPMAKMLLAVGGAWSSFYSPEEVERLAERIQIS